MTFLASAIGFCLAAISVAQWCVSLSLDHLSIVKEDRQMRDWGRETVFTARDIERQNRVLETLEASCAAAALPAPNVLQHMRQLGRAIARAQDLHWTWLRTRLLSNVARERADLSTTQRGPPGICTPGNLSWRSMTLLTLRSRMAGVVVERTPSGTLSWSFAHPDVRRNLR